MPTSGSLGYALLPNPYSGFIRKIYPNKKMKIDHLLNKLKAGKRKLAKLISFKKDNIYIAKGSFIASDVKIGKNTRINASSHIATCEIGAFCAIGGRLVVRSSDHSISYLNMQRHFQNIILGSDIKVAGISKGVVKIGNGVWIGDSVIILKDVVVGNGAVIGAGSIVTKSIPAYSISVGNPAKVIKYRFKKEVCELIDSTRWWEWDTNKLKKNKFLFDVQLDSLSVSDIESLLSKIK